MRLSLPQLRVAGAVRVSFVRVVFRLREWPPESHSLDGQGKGSIGVDSLASIGGISEEFPRTADNIPGTT